MRFRTVLFDAGGVLVSPNWSRASAALARQGVRVAPSVLAAAEPHVKQALDVAPTVRTTSDAQRGYLFFDLILKHVGIEADSATDAALAELKTFNDAEGTWDSVAPDAIDTLTRLRTAGRTIAVVSNSNGTLRRMFARVSLAPCVDVIVDSFEEGIEKPDPRLFRLALERAGGSCDAAIHCGDLYQVDIVGLRAAGLPAVLLDPGWQYAHADCPRVTSITAFADGVIDGAFD